MVNINKFVAKAPPKISDKEAREFIQLYYQLEPLVLKGLESYEDQNFYLQVKDGREFVLKISRKGEDAAVLECQHRAMERLKSLNPSFAVPQIHPTPLGMEIVTMPSHGFLVRILTFVSGSFLGEMVSPSLEFPESLGCFFGKLTKALEDFSHPGAWRYSRWDLKNALDLRPLVSVIADPEKRRLVEYFLLQFEVVVAPLLSQLRTGVIHGDGNEQNVLAEGGKNSVVGVIDFGDMVSTPTICELSIAATYSMIGRIDPFERGASVVKGFHRENPLCDEEWDLLFPLMGTRLCMSAIYATLQALCDPGNEYVSSSLGPTWELLEKMASTNPLWVKDLFRKSCGLSSSLDRPEVIPHLQHRREEHLGKNLSLSYQRPLKIVHGAYQYLFDGEGRAYVDGVNNVAHVGHGHPRVVRAAQKQMALLNTNTRYLHDHILALAERLAATMPDPLTVCFFVCSGSEATDLALRLSRAHTRRTGVIVVDGAYHGNTTAAIELSPYKFDGPGGEGAKAAPSTYKTLMPDSFRGAYRGRGPQIGSLYAADVKNILEANANKEKIGAFFCESILGCGGQIVPPENYLKEAFAYVRQYGGLCVADEVQVGFGRVGTHFWGFELHGVVPDIVVLGKPMGNGHPLAAVVTTREIADSFANGMEYFNTFGGNPVSCAVGLSVLDVIKEENLQAHAREVGDFLKARFLDLASRYPLIGDVRGEGLFLGLELVSDPESLKPAAAETKKIVEALKDRGFLLSIDGPFHNVIKFKPPLVFSMKNALDLVICLENILEKIKN